MDEIKKAYDKWQCIENNDNDIGMLMFSKGDLFRFAEYYHQSQVNNVVSDGVIKCDHPKDKQKWKMDWIVCEKCNEILH